MQIKFIFPPFSKSSMNGPYLAPYLLSAVLLSGNIKSEVVDLNIQVIHQLLSEKFILKVLAQGIVDSEQKILETFLKRNQLKYFAWNTDSLISLLGILKKYCFTDARSIHDCFRENLNHRLTDEIYQNLIRENQLHETDIIGISIPFPEQLAESVRISRLIRETNKKCKIIAGGCQINMMSEKDLEFVSGQDIFDVIAKGNFDSEISNLVTSVGKNKFYKITHSRSEAHYKTDKIPDIDFGDLEKYAAPLIIPVPVSKGCWWGKCVFCDYRRLNQKYCERSPEDVYNEISRNRLKHPDAVFFLVSDAISSAWYAKLCRIAVKEKGKINTWSYMIHSEKLDATFFDLLATAGVNRVTFGTENTIDSVLSRMNKNFSFEIIAANLKDSAGAGIPTNVNIIPDFPGTTYQEAQKNLLQLKELSGFISMLNVQTFILNSGTEISLKPEKFDILINKTESHADRGFNRLHYTDKNGMSDAEKKVINEGLNALSWKIRSRQVLDKMLSRTNDDSILFFNPIIINPDPVKPVFLIMPQLAVYHPSLWEVDVFMELFNEERVQISMADLLSVFSKHNPVISISFSGWFIKLLCNSFVAEIKK